MMLSKLVVKWLEWIIEIGIWLSLIGAFITGFKQADGFFGGLFAGLLSTVVAGIFCALVFGAFIVLMDIRTMMKNELASRTQN